MQEFLEEFLKGKLLAWRLDMYVKKENTEDFCNSWGRKAIKGEF